jgi:AraC-like DNA-binding protein
MSERSFSRHYAESTGLTPARAVERLRVEGARRLLTDTRCPSSAFLSAVVLDRKKRCLAASSAYWTPHHKSTEPDSAHDRPRQTILAAGEGAQPFQAWTWSQSSNGGFVTLPV